MIREKKNRRGRSLRRRLKAQRCDHGIPLCVCPVCCRTRDQDDAPAFVPAIKGGRR